MEKELFQKLVSDPGRWPYYIVLAVIIWFIFKIVGFAAESAWSHMAKSVKDRVFLRRLIVPTLQIIAITVAVYFFSSFYWSRHLQETINSPQVLASRLTWMDKAVLIVGYQAKHTDLGESANIARTQERIDELGKLPPGTFSLLFADSHQSLVRMGLIEDLPISPSEGNKISLKVPITPIGEKVFEHLRDKDDGFDQNSTPNHWVKPTTNRMRALWESKRLSRRLEAAYPSRSQGAPRGARL